MKENVICGHLIPAGTGLREYNSLIVAGKDDIEAVIEKPEIINVEAVETKAL